MVATALVMGNSYRKGHRLKAVEAEIPKVVEFVRRSGFTITNSSTSVGLTSAQMRIEFEKSYS